MTIILHSSKCSAKNINNVSFLISFAFISFISIESQISLRSNIKHKPAHTHTHTHTYTHTTHHTHTHTHTLTHTLTHSYTPTHTQTHRHPHTHTNTPTLTHTHTHTHTNSHTLTPTLTHIHTQTHTHTQTNTHTLHLPKIKSITTVTTNRPLRERIFCHLISTESTRKITTIPTYLLILTYLLHGSECFLRS